MGARPLNIDLVVAAEARGFILGAAVARELGVGFVPARKPGKLPAETVSAEYILEYGVDALEMHADALADGARGAAARRPAGHGRHGPRAGGADRGPRQRGRGLRLPGRAGVPRRAREARRLRRPARCRTTSEARTGLLGLGRAGGGARRCPSTRTRCCARSWGSPAAWSRGRSRWRTCSRRPALAAGCASGSRSWPRCATTARRACCAAAASPISTCWRSAPATASGAGRGRGARGCAQASRRCCGRAPRRASPWCRSAAGRASSAGSAGERPYVSRSTSAGWTACSWSTRARGWRSSSPGSGCPRPTRRCAPARARARPRAAELRVGDGRRLRGDALGGQTSTGHGRIDEQVVALECVTPSGSLATLDAPASAAGPALRELVLGSEGTLGVITQVALRVRPVRSSRPSTAGASARSWRAPELLRELEQDGIAPDIARLSDEEETRLSVALAGGAGAGRARSSAGRPLPARGLRLLEGASARLRLAGRKAGAAAARAPLGWASPAARGRSHASPARTCATTCSTAACWSRRSRRRRPGATWSGCTGRSAARCRGSTSAATCRTCIRPAPRCTSPCSARQDPDPVAQWRAVKDAAARRSSPRADDHAPPRDRPRPRALPGRRDRRARARAAARGQGALRPGRDHEPGSATVCRRRRGPLTITRPGSLAPFSSWVTSTVS